MKKHPETGAGILKQIKLLGQDVDVILHHHERWEGTGYPDLLRGTSIPLGARLIAIADAYEAMTSVRPYRGKMSADEALAELERCAGTQFDPALVELFAKAVADIPLEDDTEEETSLFRPSPEQSHAGLAEVAATRELAKKTGCPELPEPEAGDQD